MSMDEQQIRELEQRIEALVGRARQAAADSGAPMDLDTTPDMMRMSRPAYEAACAAIGADALSEQELEKKNPRSTYGGDALTQAGRRLAVWRYNDRTLEELRRLSEEGMADFDVQRVQYWWSEGADAVGSGLSDYPGHLPEELEPWFAVLTDGGYSIGVVLKHRVQGREHLNLENDVCGVPVRTVLRQGWEITPSGFVAVDLAYHPIFGAEFPDKDMEFPGRDEDDDEDGWDEDDDEEWG